MLGYDGNRSRLIAYAGILLLASATAVVFSFYAERGGITPMAAGIAPLLGPWAQILSPNAHAMDTWSLKFTVCALALLLSMCVSISISFFARKHWLRFSATTLAIPAIILWVLFGLVKVIVQLH